VGQSGLILRIRGAEVLTWVKMDWGTRKRLSAVRFVDASRGWAAGESGVRRRTTNGGRTWPGRH